MQVWCFLEKLQQVKPICVNDHLKIKKKKKKLLEQKKRLEVIYNSNLLSLEKSGSSTDCYYSYHL